MEWTEAIKEIRRAKEQNRLVLFVGSGVSKNSGIPTWGDLIRSIADVIGYEKCYTCQYAETCSQDETCQNKKSFNQDDFLRIPEYFYNTCKEKQTYFDFISSQLDSGASSNVIDNEIINTNPHHIITTNYDDLLEKVPLANRLSYEVVAEDKELIAKTSDKYLIKMHGTLTNTKTIVLKESDYLDYEQKHPIISTFIRSLLINHTFVYIGYSMNDSTLNMILNWINYFGNYYDVKHRPKSFLITPSLNSDFEINRFINKNIHPVDLSSIPKEVINNIQQNNTLTNETGKMLHSFLYCINHMNYFQQYTGIGIVAKENGKYLKKYNWISWKDLITVVFGKGAAYPIGNVLMVLNEHKYKEIESIIKGRKKWAVELFQKAGIVELRRVDGKEAVKIPSKEIKDKYLYIEWNNDYSRIDKEFDSMNKTDQCYYEAIMKEDISTAKGLLKEEEASLIDNSVVSLALLKTRKWLLHVFWNKQTESIEELRLLYKTLTSIEMNSVLTLNKMFNSSDKDYIEMEKILDNHKKRYKYKIDGWMSGHAFYDIWKLQSYAYNYYLFCKLNRIPMDLYVDLEAYLSYYIESMLCSYSLICEEKDGYAFGYTDRKEYPLSEMDFDMLVKHLNSKKLKQWLNEYQIKHITFQENYNISKKYSNLCKSMKCLQFQKWLKYMKNFTMLLPYIDFTNRELYVMYSNLVDVFVELLNNTSKNQTHILTEIMDILYVLAKNSNVKKYNKTNIKLVKAIINSDIISDYNCRYKIKRISICLYGGIKKEDSKELYRIINSTDGLDKLRLIVVFHNLLPEKIYNSYLYDCAQQIETHDLFELVCEKIIKFDKKIENIFIKRMNDLHQERVANPGMRTYPDRLQETLDTCILLHLIDTGFDVQRLKDFTQYSEPLTFILNPEEYDYNKVDTSDYRWVNVINTDRYQPYFIKHKDYILTSKLKEVFEAEKETQSQRRIVYGILLDKDELYNW